MVVGEIGCGPSQSRDCERDEFSNAVELVAELLWLRGLAAAYTDRAFRRGGIDVPASFAASIAYPSARAFDRTRSSRVRIVTSCGGSSSNSAVAKWIASSARIGST